MAFHQNANVEWEKQDADGYSNHWYCRGWGWCGCCLHAVLLQGFYDDGVDDDVAVVYTQCQDYKVFSSDRSSFYTSLKALCQLDVKTFTCGIVYTSPWCANAISFAFLWLCDNSLNRPRWQVQHWKNISPKWPMLALYLLSCIGSKIMMMKMMFSYIGGKMKITIIANTNIMNSNANKITPNHNHIVQIILCSVPANTAIDLPVASVARFRLSPNTFLSFSAIDCLTTVAIPPKHNYLPQIVIRPSPTQTFSFATGCPPTQI